MNMRRPLTFLATGLAAWIAVSCVSSSNPTAPAPAPAPPRVWPPAPNQPRIAYVESLHGPRDVGQGPGAFRALADWITGEPAENLDLCKPFAVALDEKGTLCIADTDARLVCHVDFAHRKWKRYAGAGRTKFASPVAVARRNGIFYVADSELDKVIAFDDRGQALFELGAPMKRPVGLAIAGDSLFVVDSQAHAVFAYGLDGKFKFQFGRRGTDPGEFNFPTCAVADHHGHLVISDTINCRVQVFDLDGRFVSQFGSNGDTSGHFARPKGIAVDSEGHIYVVDAVFDNFQVFDADGQLLLNVGESGANPGEFGLPNGIAIGANNRIYVADAFNHRVQIFKYVSQP